MHVNDWEALFIRRCRLVTNQWMNEWHLMTSFSFHRVSLWLRNISRWMAMNSSHMQNQWNTHGSKLSSPYCCCLKHSWNEESSVVAQQLESFVSCFHWLRNLIPLVMAWPIMRPKVNDTNTIQQKRFRFTNVEAET